MNKFWEAIAMAPEDGGGAADGGSPSPSSGGGGGGSDPTTTQNFDWAATLGDAHATYAETLTAKGWKGPADVLADYKALSEQAAGRIAIPGENATPEERAAFYAALGRPEQPSGYKFERPQDVPEDAWNEERMGRFAQTAHELGLSAAQAEGIVKWMGQDIAAELADLPAQREANAKAVDDALTQAWGGQKPAKMELARRAFSTFAPDLKDSIDALGVQIGDAQVVQLFARIGEAMGEDSLRGGGGTPRLLTPEAAQAELANRKKDPAFTEALHSATHPNHAKVLAEWQGLQRAILAK